MAVICRKMGISEATFYNWKKRYAGMGVSEVRELRLLREENAKLKLAEVHGVSLHGNDGSFPFEATIVEEIRNTWASCLEEYSPLNEGLTGTDLKRRQMSQLLAESLHDHDSGAEHLLWRSKRFAVGGSPVDPE